MKSLKDLKVNKIRFPRSFIIKLSDHIIQSDEDEIIENVYEEKKVNETENQKSIEAKKSKALRKKVI